MSCKISKELADFLNLNYLKNDERISRVKITKLIDSYIETNGLREYRTIKPDEKLKNLLNCGDNEVTFSNLQSYIAPHIICMNCMNVNVGTGTGTGIGFVVEANLMHVAVLFRSFKGLRFILHNQYPLL
jgi:hypothetical protein